MSTMLACDERELSLRQREILALIAAGRSNRGICQELWLSPKTVETHIRHILCKLRIPDGPDDNRRVLATLTYLGIAGSAARSSGCHR